MAKKPVAAPADGTPVIASEARQSMPAAPETGSYLVGNQPILQDGKRYEEGATITCTPAQAERLGLVPAPAETTEDVKNED